MTGVWGSRSVPASSVPDARRVRPQARPLTKLQERIVAALAGSTSGPLTSEELAVLLGDGVSKKGIELSMPSLQRQKRVRWTWVHRGGSGRARKGFSLVRDGEA